MGLNAFDFTNAYRRKRRAAQPKPGSRPPLEEEEYRTPEAEKEAYRAAVEHEFARRLGFDEYPEN